MSEKNIIIKKCYGKEISEKNIENIRKTISDFLNFCSEREILNIRILYKAGVVNTKTFIKIFNIVNSEMQKYKRKLMFISFQTLEILNNDIEIKICI